MYVKICLAKTAHVPHQKNSTNPKPSCQLSQKKITFIQVDLPVQISDLWASLDTDGDGRVRMEVRYTRRGRDPPVTDQQKLAGESYLFCPENERLEYFFP